MPRKCILILLDGLGDRSFARFGHRTPLQAADTPCLDSLATIGSNGLYHASRPGEALPSELAHFSLFGYERDDFPGRGPLEALGADMSLGPDDVAVLAHFVHARSDDGQLRLIHDRLTATDDETRILEEAIGEFETDGIRIRYRQTKGLFGIITMQGETSPFFTDSNPMVDGRFLSEILPLASHADDAATRRTARALKRYLTFVWQTLAPLTLNKERERIHLPPVNMMVTQRAGRRKPVMQFRKKFGMRGASIASGVLFRGVARYLGLDHVPVTDSGNPAQDISSRIAQAEDMLAEYDFIHVHTKTPDQAAHTKNPETKKAVIEALDRGISQSIRPLLDAPEVLVAVTADHSTPSRGNLIHSGESVPLLFVGNGLRRDTVTSFDEISAATGCLGCVKGTEFMNLVLNGTDRARLAGIRDTPEDQAFWPGDYTPFTLSEESD